MTNGLAYTAAAWFAGFIMCYIYINGFTITAIGFLILALIVFALSSRKVANKLFPTLYT